MKTINIKEIEAYYRKELATLGSSPSLDEIIDFSTKMYFDIKAENCDSDMLLYQYGSYNQEFEWDVTRQWFIEDNDEGDDEPYQLSLCIKMPFVRDIDNLTCWSDDFAVPEDLEKFTRIIKETKGYAEANKNKDRATFEFYFTKV